MNYEKLYDKIIENRQRNPINEGYTEKHHILPRSFGGSDNPDNLVKLSSREHFIAHYLLAKMYSKETNEWYKMNHAFMLMKESSFSHSGNRYFNSRLYEALKGNFSSVMSFAQSGEKNSQHGTCWICDIEKQENKKIPKEDLQVWISKGYVKGRSKWNEKKVDTEKLSKKVIKYTEWYFVYEKFGFDIFKETVNYEYSKQNLVNLFKKYVKEFIPQNGKKRG